MYGNLAGCRLCLEHRRETGLSLGALGKESVFSGLLALYMDGWRVLPKEVI